MIRIEDQILISAPAAKVWTALKDPLTHPQWHRFVMNIKGLHERGERRYCDVKVGGKKALMEEVCVQCEEMKAIQWRIEKDGTGFSDMVADWSSWFLLTSNGGSTTVTASSLFEPKGWMARLMMPLIRFKFHGTQKEILQGLKKYSESRQVDSE